MQVKAGNYEGTIYHVQIDLTSEKPRELLNCIGQIEKKIAIFKERFQLPEKKRKPSGMAISVSGYLWSVLIDKKAARMKRYGLVPTELEQELDSRIEELLGLMNHLSQIVRKSKAVG